MGSTDPSKLDLRAESLRESLMSLIADVYLFRLLNPDCELPHIREMLNTAHRCYDQHLAREVEAEVGDEI